MRFVLPALFLLCGPVSAAEPLIRSRIAVQLPTGQTTLTEVRKAFTLSGRPLVTLGEWDDKRKLTLDAAKPQAGAPGVGENYLAALDRVARAVGGRIAIEERGNVLKLATATGPTIASIDGDFRTVVVDVASRLNLETNRRTLEVTLLCHWEPSFRVVRIDGEATMTGVTLDVGKTSHTAAKTKTPTRDSNHVMTLRFTDVPRAATTISLKGSYAVTAAESAQAISFDANKAEATSKPGPQDAEVTATLLPLKSLPDRWEATIELTYPAGGIEFESFESALRFTRNEFALVAPDGKQLAPINDDLRESPTKTTLVYRFPSAKVPKDRAGWRAVVTTPTRFHEFPVSFDLPNIPLP